MKKLKIAFISVARNPIPPKLNTIDGIASISSTLAIELSKKGHDVSFFCPKGSTIPIPRIESRLPAISDFYSKTYYKSLTSVARAELLQPFNGELHFLLEDHVKKNEFDLIHFHTSPMIFSLPLTRRISIPKVFTLHDQFSEPYDRVFDMYSSITNNYYVSISYAQRKLLNYHGYISNIYHGLTLKEFPFQEDPQGKYLFFSGRFHPAKGLDIAILIAKKLNKQLFFTGQQSYSSLDYYQEKIQPFINNAQIQMKKLQNKKELTQLYSHAKTLIFPIQWEEPFGLVLIEAMATGTPVVAFARGSVSEVVKDGETGFIVNSSDDDIRGNWIIKKTGIEGLCEAVERIYAMWDNDYRTMRRNCRAHVEKNFTIQRMVDEYEKVYEKILSRNPR